MLADGTVINCLPRTSDVHILRRSSGVPHQGGTTSAPPVHRQLGQPAAAQNWKEGPVTRQKGGASALRTGGRPRQSFLLLRALRAADVLSLPLAPADASSIVRVGWVREVFDNASCSGEGSNGKATRPTGVLRCAQRERASAFLPDLPSATRAKIEALRAKSA